MNRMVCFEGKLVVESMAGVTVDFDPVGRYNLMPLLHSMYKYVCLLGIRFTKSIDHSVDCLKPVYLYVQ